MSGDAALPETSGERGRSNGSGTRPGAIREGAGPFSGRGAWGPAKRQARPRPSRQERPICRSRGILRPFRAEKGISRTFGAGSPVYLEPYLNIFSPVQRIVLPAASRGRGGGQRGRERTAPKNRVIAQNLRLRRSSAGMRPSRPLSVLQTPSPAFPGQPDAVPAPAQRLPRPGFSGSPGAFPIRDSPPPALSGPASPPPFSPLPPPFSGFPLTPPDGPGPRFSSCVFRKATRGPLLDSAPCQP
jgi:hypothetical protein